MRRARTIHGIRISLLLALVASLLLALAGCGGVTGEPPGGGDGVSKPDKPLISDSASPNYVLAVDLVPGDKVEDIEALYGGDVLVWEPSTDDLQGFALIGLMSEPIGMDAGTWDQNEKEFIAGAPGESATMNGSSTLWAEGASTLWAEGASTLWAEGASTLWAEGQFQLLPQNTDAWQQVDLQQAQLLAGQLGKGVKVAVIDTGIDLSHPVFENALAPASQWWDFVGNDNVPQEEGELGVGGYGHGTAVAAIIRQVVPNVTILPLRVLGPEGVGDVAGLAAAIDWAASMGVDIINLSLGATKHVNTVDKALKRAVEQGVFVVTSAGNDNATKLSYPASEASTGKPDEQYRMLSVTSIGRDDVKSAEANFSGKVEVAAPGDDILAPIPGDFEHMASWTGTSMAAPIVTGALALALAEALQAERSQVAEELKLTASPDIYLQEGNSAFKQQKQLGEGRLDVYGFLFEVMGEEGE